MSGLENLMDNFSLSNSTSMKGKSMNTMKGGATTSTPMSTAKSSKAEADLLDDLFGSTPKKGPSGVTTGGFASTPAGGGGAGSTGADPLDDIFGLGTAPKPINT